MKGKQGIVFHFPDHSLLTLSHLVLDFTGTLGKDGLLIPGVAPRIRKLHKLLSIVIATADTFGTVKQALAGLPVEIKIVSCGADKARLVAALAGNVAAIGNGNNDVPMFRRVALSIAIIGPEGSAGRLVTSADIVVHDVRDALDLLLNPLRLVATLRR